MARTLHCQAVLFDMDGTLVDSTRSVESIWTRWARQNDLDPRRILEISHGRRTLDTLREIAPHLDIEAEAEALETEEIGERDGVVEVPGARALIAQLPCERWAVVTSASRPLAEARLGAAQMPIPALLVTAGMVRVGKPDPEGYLLAAARLGFAPADCLVVEDTPAGLHAGRAAGMQTLAVTTTFASDLLPADLWVADFRRVSVTVTAGGLELHV